MDNQALRVRYEALLDIACQQEREIKMLKGTAWLALGLAVLGLFTGCAQERRDPVIETGTVEILPEPVAAPVEPMPVVVAPGLPEQEPAHPARVLGWRSRCRGGFITLSGGQVLSCRM